MGRYPKNSKNKKTRRVRIAVIDTGVDLEKIKKGKKRIQNPPRCFIPGMEEEGAKDDSGHGTTVIQLLLDVAPEANIYSYRVFHGAQEEDSTEGIARAISQAITDEVDIINMSFGFRAFKRNICDELERAISKRILIFAAASNTRLHHILAVAWPANERGVFAVFATDHEGRAWEHNPTSFEVPRFATLGDNIKPSTTHDDHQGISGTSYATPVVAGTAALLLDFARLEPDDNHKELPFADYISRYNSMEALLRVSSQPVNSSDGVMNYVMPWHLFLNATWDRGMIANEIRRALQPLYGFWIASS